MTRLSKITPDDIREHNAYREDQETPFDSAYSRHDKFIHLCLKTPLEPYSEELFKFYKTSNLKCSENEYVLHERKKIRHFLKVCHVLVSILRDLRASTVRWGKEVVEDVYISDDTMVHLQNDLIEYIAEIEMASGLGLFSEPVLVEAIKIKWADLLSGLPERDMIDYEENRFTDESFEYVAKGIEECYSKSERLFELTDEMLVREFLKFIKSFPVELNNDLYRAVYDCLKFFRWIPQEIITTHNDYVEKGMNRYIRETYIKSKFKNLKDGDFDWGDFISAAIDPDWYDPRK